MKNKKKTDLRSGAKVAAEKPISNIDKNDKTVILARMHEIKKYKDDISSTQNTIGYMQMFRDGVCQIDDHSFSKTIQFFDTNYQLAEFEEQNGIFSKYCDLINYFDNTVTFQLTFENQNRSQDGLVKQIQIPAQEDDFNEIRAEYSEMLTSKLLSGKNGQSCRKFLTFTIEANSYKQAKPKLLNIQTEIIKMFKGFNVEAKALSGKERLETLYYSLNPFQSTPFVFDWNEMLKAGYDPDILPPAIKMYITDLEKLLDDLNSKNERLFHISITIRNYARNKKDLGLQLELLKRICQKNNCTLMPCDYLQEDYLSSSLPLGVNKIQVSREMHTSGIAIFVPFTTQELFQVGGTYYGLNTVSGNMIMANRSRLKNPNGLILGTPGSGKSFSVKREILDSFLKTTDDIIICDPEGEYFPLVQHLHGQLIRIASSSEQYINPMDINFENNMDENPISTKSDFIISLCEIIVGGKYGLTAEERSVIDRCVRAIYMDFFRNQPSREKMPILSDLHNALVKEGEIALRVANSLEMYVNGSQNLFNHRTNIDLKNRIICFDIKELGNQLKKVGMLIVQDNVWNRVTRNRAERKVTRYYIDEFHLLLKEEQTAKYSAEIWKRFRKWGGVPTGITQNVKDLLSSAEVENIFDNSDFVYMLNQAAGDRDILAEKLHISPQQMEFVTNSGPGEGLIRYDKIILPFTDNFPTDTVMYSLLTTKPLEQQLK